MPQITIIEILAEFRDLHFEKSDSVEDLSSEQHMAVQGFVDDVRQELEEYFRIYNRIQAQKKSTGLFSGFKRLAAYHDFVRAWVYSRESTDLTKAFLSWVLGGKPSPIDLYLNFQDQAADDWR